MNWGFKIAGLYVSFVCMIITLVTISMKQKVDLVTPDYYKQELAFQEKIDKSQRSDRLPVPMKWEVKTGIVELFFPVNEGETVNGKILFFRPSDSKQDKTVEIKTTGGKQIISTKEFMPGIYKIEVDWNKNGTSYYNEGIINIH